MCFPPPYECTVVLRLIYRTVEAKAEYFQSSYSCVFLKLLAVIPENWGWEEGHTFILGSSLIAETSFCSYCFVVDTAYIDQDRVKDCLCFILST